MMSVMVFAASNPDPYTACHCGVSWHPRYHDCENCEHYETATCDIGKGKKDMKDLRAAIADGETMLASYPKMNPARLP